MSRAGLLQSGTDWRQVRLLLANALRLDARAASASPGQRSRARASLLRASSVHAIIGLGMVLSLQGNGLEPHLVATLTYAVAGFISALTIALEYGNILWAPTDVDVLSWRPIASPTLFSYRALHILVYVGLLCVPLLLPGAICAGWKRGVDAVPIGLAFVVGGYLSCMLGGLILLALYAGFMARLPTDRFHGLLFGVQVFFVLALLFGQFVLGPVFDNLDFASREALQTRARFTPPGWFASLPELVSAGPRRAGLLALLVGCCSLALAWLSSVRILATPFVQASERLRDAEGDRVAGPSALERHAARLMTRSAGARMGFEFLQAQLRGDRQLRLSLLVCVLIPFGATISGQLRGRLSDPYAEPLGIPADVYSMTLGYLTLAFFGLSLHGLSNSASWKAGWVYYVAPVRDLGPFVRGISAGLAYVVLLPAVLAQAVCLWVFWRNPLHVALHLGPPLAWIPLVIAVWMLRRKEPPFSLPPVRTHRAGTFFDGLVIFSVLLLLVLLHRHLVSSPARLVAISLCGALAGCLFLWLVQRRSQPVRAYAFEG